MPHAPYKWTIDKDHLADTTQPVGSNSNAATLCGPHNCPPGGIELPDKFRMYDDDGTLYYEGRTNALTFSLSEAGRKTNVDGFEPLDDFGEPNAGCTRIDYWDPEKETWETL